MDLAIPMAALALTYSGLTYSSILRKHLPFMFNRLGDSMTTRALLVYFTYHVGRSLELLWVDYRAKPEEYKEYLNTMEYFEKLKARRLAETSYLDRLSILTPFNFSRYFKSKDSDS